MTETRIVKTKAGDDDINVDVEALARELNGKLSSGNLLFSANCSIFKIPNMLVRQNKNAYTPGAFSIGPFHHHNEALKATEKIKYKYLLDLLSRLSNRNYNPIHSDPSTILRTFTRAIDKVRKEARECYAGPIGVEADEFVKILVLDGCFIIELFRKKACKYIRDDEDPIFTMSCLLQFLCHDLILLENQIPWMVLNILFNMTSTVIDTKPLAQLAIEFFDNIFSIKPSPIEPLISNSSHKIKHVLDLLRISLLLTSSTIKRHKMFDSEYCWELESMCSASSLKDFGIKFKESGASQCILDIKFHRRKGVMEIPQLLIQETTETVFRNLISLEQCCPNYEPVITSYALLLHNLINTRQDMEILCNNKVIYTWLNIDKATRFFNSLCMDTYVKDITFYLQLMREVNEYCRGPWHRYRRVIMHDYFNHPWALISVVAASVALILTFLQTLFTIKNKE